VSDTYSKDEAYSIRIGICTILVIAVISAFYIVKRTIKQHNEASSYYSVLARFGRTDGLAVGNDVRMAGMNVGTVIQAQIDEHYKAILTLQIKDSIKIPDDSSASIVSDGVLGNKYIEIEPGGSEEFIEPGAEFVYTQDAMVLEELLDRIIGMGKANRQKNKKNESEGANNE